MPIYEALRAIPWPGEFIVEYTNGTRERLLRGNGVEITPPDDDPEGCGTLTAELPKKHPRNSTYGRGIRFTELRAILSIDGQVLWARD